MGDTKKKKPYVSIIIPLYNPKKQLLEKIIKEIKCQKGKLQFEVIKIKGDRGLANAYNQGIRKSKGEIIITLHQDCMPLEKNSITKLINPFRDEKVVLVYSWVMEKDEKRKYYPFAPDGKFTAFRKSALEEVGLFNEIVFFTGGEDVDMWLKLKKIGKIVRVKTGILHIHPNYKGNKTIEKRRQNGSINGALTKIWGIRNPKWFKSILLCFIFPFSYGKEYIKAYISGKQTYRRKE